MIIIFPNSPEPIGQMCRRFAALGYTLSNNGAGRIIATPMAKARPSAVAAVFAFGRRPQ